MQNGQLPHRCQDICCIFHIAFTSFKPVSHGVHLTVLIVIQILPLFIRQQLIHVIIPSVADCIFDQLFKLQSLG